MHMVAVFWALAGVSGYQNTLLYQELYMTLPFEHVERMSQLLGVSQQVRAASSLTSGCANKVLTLVAPRWYSQAGALCGALGTFLCVYIVTS